MPDLLTDAERRADLPALGAGGWGAVPDRDAIRKVWKFRNFVDAWGFMSRAALGPFLDLLPGHRVAQMGHALSDAPGL